MVRTSHGAYGRVAHLECDVCGEQLAAAIALLEFGAPPPAVGSNLREKAQIAGWSAMLSRNGGQWRDLCPDCYSLPPEG